MNAIPICIATKNNDDPMNTVKLISPGLCGINLEDIAAHRCFKFEDRLKQELDIPVFHDDQHGTAIVVLAALINALRIVDKSKPATRIVICGAGSAGIAIAKFLQQDGFQNIVMVDKSGVLCRDATWMNWAKRKIAESTNPHNITGTLADSMSGADVFVGVSGPGVLAQEMVKSMTPNAMVLARANPEPKILPHLALEAGARIVVTGRSDLPNQVNNTLAFPGISMVFFKHARKPLQKSYNSRPRTPLPNSWPLMN